MFERRAPQTVPTVRTIWPSDIDELILIVRVPAALGG